MPIEINATIAAISTPLGTGGIGIVRLSGPDAIEIAGRVFRSGNKKALKDLAGYSGILGRIYDDNGDIDECIAFVYIAPKSYTGEDVVELSCHGGVWIIRKVLRICFENGAIPAEPGEFTKRAFLNGKLDLLQAESVQNLISAKTEAAAKAALSVMDGALTHEIRNIAGMLTSQSAHLAAWADYPEDDIEDVSIGELLKSLNMILSKIEQLLKSYDKGRIIYEGVYTAIIGKPNVGKSTLMNLLSGYQRSIVTEVPGTTRDIVQEAVQLRKMTLTLCDTAGIRNTKDRVEMIGVENAKNLMERAQLVLAVFDASQKLSKEDYEILEQLREKLCVAVINKIDLSIKIDAEAIAAIAGETVFISAEKGEGIEDLESAIERIVGMDYYDSAGAIISSERQMHLIKKACKSVEEAITALNSGVTLDAVNVEIDYALDALLSISGEKASDKVINEVFTRFCVGK